MWSVENKKIQVQTCVLLLKGKMTDCLFKRLAYAANFWVAG